MKKKVITGMISFVGSLILVGGVADAATVFSYEGFGIRNIDSKRQGHIGKGKKVTVKHNQSGWSNANTNQKKAMKISLRRKQTFGSTHTSSVTYYGNITNQTKTFSSKLGTGGTHFLRFATEKAGSTANPTVNIRGSLIRN